jgi:type IV pilus assembly protein PilM
MPSQQMPSPLKANVSLGSLSFKSLLRAPALSGGLGALGSNVSFRRRRTVVVGVDIQPGYVAAARAHLNGGLVIDRAATVALDADTVREGEVLNQDALAGALRELFSSSGLDRHVRLGIANQRTVMRMLEVPPLSDSRELAAAVRFQAEDQVPMPLASAVVDFRALGVVDTPQGARQRVLLVAAQKETVERMLGAVRAAGLQPEGIDLSAFALIRSLYRPERDRLPVAGAGTEGAEAASRVLHLNVGGLTNMVIAEGTNCRFTRVLSRGLEAVAAEVAERRGVPIAHARELLRGVGLGSHTGAVPSGHGGLSGLSAMGSHGGAQDAEALAIQLDRERSASEGDEAARAVEAVPAREPVTEPEQTADPQAAEAIAPAEAAPLQAVPAPYGEDEIAGEVPGAIPPGVGAEPGAMEMAAVTAEPGGQPPHESGGDVQVGFPHAVDPTPPEAGVEPAGEGTPAPEAELGAPEPPSLTVIDGAGGEEQPAAQAEGADAGSHTGQEDAAAMQAAVVAEPDPAMLATHHADAEELAEVRLVLEAGVRAIAGEVRNSLDFYQAQEQAAGLGLVVLSGPALDIPGFAEMLEQNLGLPVASETVPAAGDALGGYSPQYFAIAAGLAVEEVQA